MNITPELTIEREAEERGGWTPGEVSTGTTIVAASGDGDESVSVARVSAGIDKWNGLRWPPGRYDGGVVLGADSRVTTGTSRRSATTSSSAARVRRRSRVGREDAAAAAAAAAAAQAKAAVLAVVAGSAADTQLVSDYVRHYLEQHAVELEDGRPAVRTAANLVMQLNYNNKDHLMAGMVSARTRREPRACWAVAERGTRACTRRSARGGTSTRAAACGRCPSAARCWRCPTPCAPRAACVWPGFVRRATRGSRQGCAAGDAGLLTRTGVRGVRDEGGGARDVARRVERRADPAGDGEQRRCHAQDGAGPQHPPLLRRARQLAGARGGAAPARVPCVHCYVRRGGSLAFLPRPLPPRSGLVAQEPACLCGCSVLVPPHSAAWLAARGACAVHVEGGLPRRRPDLRLTRGQKLGSL
eukprot:scaffold3155_cov358-Prasinococcus_capsulatus_cf.AAC.3